MTSSLLQSHETYKGFSVLESKPIPELALHYLHLVHNKSGATLIHLKNSDPENVFCISLQTLPNSSNGVAHILEHTVLCGSQKYPVKDPFFSMIRRSLNTFMNAFTGMDFTCYPASSENVTDFYNLFEVYLDAVFFPKLTKESFLQEGHRLEFADPKRTDTPLTYGGIVFNEMKGAMSSMESRFWQHLMAHLFPDLPYRHNSGGDPKEIPLLTHEELSEFHRYFYAPSNALFYFYGDIDTRQHIDFLEEKLLSVAEKKTLSPPIQPQPRFSHPVQVEEVYPGKEGDDAVIGLAFLTAPVQDTKAIFALTLLENILLDTDASPLKKALLDLGIKQVDSYFETDLSEAPFVLLCQGCKDVSAEEIQECIFSTLRSLAKESIPSEKIQEALHSLEFSRKEIVQDSYPYGLHLFMRAVLPKQHGTDPLNALQVDEIFANLRLQTKNPEFFSLLIHTYFLDNPHFVTLTLTPDQTLLSKEQEAETMALETLQKHLAPSQSKAIVESAAALQTYQDALEKNSVDCLPKISLQDICPTSKKTPLEKKTTRHREIFTNHVVYIDGCLPLPKLSPEEIPYLSLFADFFSEVGTKQRTFSENLSFINGHLGGLDAYISTNTQAKDAREIRPLLVIRSKALFRNTETLASFLQEMLQQVDFSDTARLEQLLTKESVLLKNQIVSQSMHYAKSLARSGTTQGNYLYDLLYGFRYLQTVERLAKSPKKSALYLGELFTKWQKVVLGQPVEWIITTDKESYNSLEKNEFFGLTSASETKSAPFSKEDIPLSPQESEAWTIPSSVAFSALCLPIPQYLSPHAAGLYVAGELMQNTTLHREIREKGGAYGSGADCDPLRGDITLRAYRDPKLFASREIFHQAINGVESGKFTQQDLEEAILGVIQDLDQPLSPGAQGLNAYLKEQKGITPEIEDTLRQQILHLQKHDVQQAVSTIAPFESATWVSFASELFFTRENQGEPHPLPVKKIWNFIGNRI